MSNEFSLDLSYSIKYDTQIHIPLKDVIKALESLDTLLSSTSYVFGKMANVDVKGQQIFVTRVETGSLLEDVLVKIFFKDKKELDKALLWINSNIKMKSLIVGMVLSGALFFGYNVLTKSNKDTLTQNATIKDSQNSNIFNIHGDVLDDNTKEVINKAITESMDKEKTARQTLNFIDPVRSDPQSSISFSGDGVSASNIEFDVISNVPESYTPLKNNTFEEMYGVTVKLRATDLDNKKSGWAGLIEGTTERVKVELDPTLDVEEMYGKKEVKADITLEKVYNKKDNILTPKRIIIRKIY